MKKGVVIQARRASTRFADKIFQKLPMKSQKSVLEQVITRASEICENVIVATTEDKLDDFTEQEAIKYGAKVYRGSTDDVLSRYVGAIDKFGLDFIVRLTSDCPCVDPRLVKDGLIMLEEMRADYVSNVEDRLFPVGLDFECFTKSALLKADALEKRSEIREHVTYHIRLSDNFKKVKYTRGGKMEHANIRVTLDTKEDYVAIAAVYDLLGEKFGFEEIVSLYEKYEWLHLINAATYHKKPFACLEEEVIEAKRLLKLHKMENILKMIDG